MRHSTLLVARKPEAVAEKVRRCKERTGEKERKRKIVSDSAEGQLSQKH